MMKTLKCWVGWYFKELTNCSVREKQNASAFESPSHFMLSKIPFLTSGEEATGFLLI